MSKFVLAIGFSILPVISYILLGVNAFSAFAIIFVALILVVVIFAILLREKKISLNFSFQFPSESVQTNSKQRILLTSLILIMIFAFLLSIRAIYNRFTLLEIDPWYWLYNTRFLVTENTLDYSSIKSYPAGMAFFTIALIFLEPTYEFLYVIYRFFGPIMSLLIVLSSFVVGMRAFPDKIAPPIIIAIASTVSHHLLFAYYLARPETIAIFLFIITLNYIFQSENPSPVISTVLIVGIFLYHPLTCAVLLGILITSKITGSILNPRQAARQLRQ